MSDNTFTTVSIDSLDTISGGAGAETPSIYDPTFRADVLGPCAVAAGAQALLAQQSGKPFDGNNLTDVCAGAVGTRKVIKSIQGL